MSFREALDMKIASLEAEIAKSHDTKAIELKQLLFLLRDTAMRPRQAEIVSLFRSNTIIKEENAKDAEAD